MFFCQESSPSLFFGSWVLWRLSIFQCFCSIRVEWLYLQFTRRYVSKFSKYVLIQSLLQIWNNQFRGSKASDLLDSGRIQQNMWSSMHRLLVQSRRIRNRWLVFFLVMFLTPAHLMQIMEFLLLSMRALCAHTFISFIMWKHISSS